RERARWRLAGPRRSGQQDAPLEVRPLGERLAGVPRHAEYLPFDPVQHVGRQDDLIPADARAVKEAQQRPADAAERVTTEDVAAEREDMAAEHVVLDRQPPDLVHHLLAALAVGTGHLDRDALLPAVLVRAAEQRHER